MKTDTEFEPRRDRQHPALRLLAEDRADGDLDQRRWRMSLFEAMIWLATLPMILATPYWFGPFSLSICFYGTIGLVTWRLSRSISFKTAILIAVMIAFTFTVILIPFVFR